MAQPDRHASYWIDTRLQALPDRPWRKVHLDFHNSQHIPRIGDAFDADVFADQLVQAHVDAAILFAKDMHGYFYYPSAYGPVHPGLSFDLFGQQVEACRRRGITVFAYYCITWDNYLAEHHPEWLVFKRDRTTYLPRFDEVPSWTALCLAHDDFVQVVLDHSREFLSRYEVDGIWYDMPLPIDGECFCSVCLAALRARGLDPFDKAVQRHHKQQILTSFLRRSYEQAHELRPGMQIDFNNQTRQGLGERVPFMDNVEAEGLPTAYWGYLYLPLALRYARGFGKSTSALTARFHRHWSDFGGLKLPRQLDIELAAIVAQGAGCSVGDQPVPAGRLHPAVYGVIGECYARIERLEPYLERAAPVVEAALLVDGLPLEDVGRTAGMRWADADGMHVLGLVKLLLESHLQFDVIDAAGPIERYPLVILPDRLEITPALAERLNRHLARGGAVLASHGSLRLGDTTQAWPEGLDLSYHGESAYAPAYLKLTDTLGQDLPDYEYALYEGSAQWKPAPGASETALAYLGEPLFQRSPEHYTGHNQTPFDHLTTYAAIVRHGRFAATAFPLSRSYYCHGYWIYRAVFDRLLRALAPRRLVETNAPSSTEIAVTQQVAELGHPERWMIHVVNYAANRRSPEHVENFEDPVPLHDVRLDLNVDAPIARAYAADDGAPLALRRIDGGWSVSIPRIIGSAIAVLETDAAR